MRRLLLLLVGLSSILAGCHEPTPLAWALAIHAGAGVTRARLTREDEADTLASLQAALTRGRTILAKGGSSLDAVEQVVILLEDDPLFNAGRGAVFDQNKNHELDASIMDGSGLRCGAVARVRTVKNPITLARYVMERTKHVLLVGDGAEKLAEAQGLEPVPPSYFDTEAREAQWQRTHVDDEGTVGAVALDQRGHLAAATSTGGLNDKLHGRVGDSAIIGAGTYANDKTCAISSTGIGEEFIRHLAAHQVSALMQYSGLSLHQAADRVVNEVMRRDDGGVIGVSRTGTLVGVFNTEGMFRGFADARGRLEVLIW